MCKRINWKLINKWERLCNVHNVYFNRNNKCPYKKDLIKYD